MKFPESIRLYGREGGREVPLQRDQMKQQFLEEVHTYKQEIIEWSSRAKAVWSYAPLEEALVFSTLENTEGVKMSLEWLAPVGLALVGLALLPILSHLIHLRPPKRNLVFWGDDALRAREKITN